MYRFRGLKVTNVSRKNYEIPGTAGLLPGEGDESPLEAHQVTYGFGEFTLDLGRGRLYRSGAEIRLRPKVFEALKYLVENSGRLIGKEELSKAIWPDSFVSDDSLVQCTVQIRRALGDADQQILKTIPRRGYVFDCPVSQSSAPQPPPVTLSSSTETFDLRQASGNLSSRRLEIPAPRTSLVGRDQDVARASRLLLDPDVRLLSFTGPGGSGKSRLAIAVARETAAAFPGGVQFIGLSAITKPELVSQAIVKGLHLLRTPKRSVAELVSDQLEAQGALLLILDNFEQVLPAAQVVSEILAQCPFLKAMVTTRASLRIYGEQEFPVSPLDVSAAVKLFEQRSTAVRPNFAITLENRTAIETICHRLDGLPLAIELAAARTRVLSPAAILERLQSRLELLTGGASDLPERQKTLRRTIDWSYDLLSEQEQRLFWRLGAFAAGATLEAVEAVCDTRQDLGISVFDGLTSLLDKNLIQRLDATGSEPRFHMLETIREYARERLLASGEEEMTERSLAAYCMVIAEEGNPELDSAARSRWLALCNAELDNFRAALDWLLEKKEIDWAVRMAMALFRFWDMHEHFVEGRTRFEALVQLMPSGYVKERGKICTFLGALSNSQGDYESADRFVRQSLGFYQELNDEWGIAAAWNALAIANRDHGDFEAAERYFERSLSYWRRLTDRISTARCLHNLANAARMRGDFRRAAVALDEAISIFREHGDPSGAAWSINQSGDLELEQGRIDSAQDLYREALAAFCESGDRWGCARSLADLGYIHYRRERFAAARDAYRQAMELFVELGHRRGIARTLEGCACIAAASGDALRAVTLEAAADRLRRQIAAPLSQVDRTRLAEELNSARQILDSAEGKRAWQTGSEMPLEDAILFALDEQDVTDGKPQDL